MPNDQALSHLVEIHKLKTLKARRELASQAKKSRDFQNKFNEAQQRATRLQQQLDSLTSSPHHNHNHNHDEQQQQQLQLQQQRLAESEADVQRLTHQIEGLTRTLDAEKRALQDQVTETEWLARKWKTALCAAFKLVDELRSKATLESLLAVTEEQMCKRRRQQQQQQQRQRDEQDDEEEQRRHSSTATAAAEDIRDNAGEEGESAEGYTGLADGHEQGDGDVEMERASSRGGELQQQRRAP
ncbi:hypothetical protein AAL_02026 [Moelleriella libera RCEF 2490]|uniref:Uncharacterized protein n=1 Tax=Moelleriella libera RCEF 2490 TaxID=1081109 RepID=A0A168F458_9HYPO|nr:hypothetical protein AAL_02026 [Moelleriella libera RCEF 2490]